MNFQRCLNTSVADRHLSARIAASVRVLHLPKLPPKGDVYDWVQAGGTAEQLWQFVESAGVEWNQQSMANETRLVIKCAADIRPKKKLIGFGNSACLLA